MILIILIIASVFVLIIVSFSYIKNLNRTSVEKITDKNIQDKNIIEHYIKNLVTNDEIEIIKKKIESLEEYFKKDNKQPSIQKKEIATSTIANDDIENDKKTITDESDIKNDELVDVDDAVLKQEKKKKKKNV
jgi:hypothetical protein